MTNLPPTVTFSVAAGDEPFFFQGVHDALDGSVGFSDLGCYLSLFRLGIRFKEP